ncbi:MAG: HD domain-containing protein [Bradymonadales bacterium]|nr:MAG: HD domain-containing protein [Bradymonadales bacterium]
MNHDMLEGMGKGAELSRSSGEAKYFQIPVNLYQPDELIHRDLYLFYQGTYLLFRPKNLRWNQKDNKQLEEFGVKSLYIKCDGKEEANQFLECNLSRILQEGKIDSGQKAQIIYETSTAILEDIFSRPNSPERVKRSVEFVKNSVEYLKDKENFLELMKMASKDFCEYTHALQTSAYAISLGRAIGIKSFNELTALGVGSILHDVGKVKIDSRILDKGEALNDDERLEVQKHPQLGFELLRRQRSIPEEAELIILQHHERPNGKGYPYGISDDLHICSKIVALVDCYDSMTSNRRYRKKLSPVNALRLIHTELREEYEPRLVTEFIKVLGVKPS